LRIIKRKASRANFRKSLDGVGNVRLDVERSVHYTVGADAENPD